MSCELSVANCARHSWGIGLFSAGTIGARSLTLGRDSSSGCAGTGANGARADQGKPQISGNTMRVGLRSLPAGSYRVRWQALSVDTHKTEGSFTFTVGGR